MNLTEKIEHEYRCFFLDMMRTSKENIFAHSGEIEAKKELALRLRELEKNSSTETAERLLLQENLLESAYQFLSMEKEFGAGDNAMEKWLRAVLQET